MNLATSLSRTIARITRLSFALALMSAALASPAHADLAPPRIQPQAKPSLPPRVKAWFTAAKAAMKSGLAKDAQALCDARGFEMNLVGGDGTALASLFSQGHRKRWHLRAELSGSKSARKAYIAAADVIDDLNGDRLDSLFVLLVPGPGDSMVALGASESRGPVEALAKRWQDGDPLPPQED